MAIEELIIDETNFENHFFDVRKNKPKKGQVMACYRAKAELLDGNEKKNLIDLLMIPEKAIAATQVMRKLFCSSEEDAVKVPKEIAQDLLDMEYDEVLKKPYPYVLEMFFYADADKIPANDPHWSTISLLNLNEFTDIIDNVTIKTKIIIPENTNVGEGTENKENQI